MIIDDRASCLSVRAISRHSTSQAPRIRETAAELGVFRQRGHRWVRRFRNEGLGRTARTAQRPPHLPAPLPRPCGVAGAGRPRSVAGRARPHRLGKRRAGPHRHPRPAPPRRARTGRLSPHRHADPSHPQERPPLRTPRTSALTGTPYSTRLRSRASACGW
ncbi:leucine zipper domain-containing protein [Nonomuraea sp. NPDC023979]|uniref:leucine zipper domain-containing protein n=1 Tax=Nonomuraea sp. NPDC023979 TaxID=3154796 RepID=UPI0033E66B0E